MISCIVTTYKRPTAILKRALDSIGNQTYRDIELIVVNDAPEEVKLAQEIERLMNGYDLPKQYIVHEQNRGACAARNTGISCAKGEWIAFLDDDDEWLPEKLEKQLVLLEKTGAALAYCSHYAVNKNGNMRIVREPLARVGIHDDEFVRLLRCNFIGSTSYPLLRTAAVKAVGGFTVGLKASQDHDLWIRIAQKYPIVYDDVPLVKLYYSDVSISRDVKNRIQGFEYLLEKYLWFYKEHRAEWNYRLNYIAYSFAREGHFRYFWKYWLRAVRVKAVSKNNLMLFSLAVNKWKRVFRV